MGSIGNNAPVGAPNIIDIRTDTAAISIKKEIISGLSVENGKEKRLPTLLLYDEKGLRLFEEITYLDEYYLTGQEIEVLQESSDRIADRIPCGSMVVELGSGYGSLCPGTPMASGACVTNGNIVTYVRSRSSWMLWIALVNT